MLSESQILILNNLMYRKEITRASAENKDVKTIVAEARNNKGSTLSEKEWTEIFDLVEKDPAIGNLTITTPKSDPVTGARMACFVEDINGEKQAYAVYAGTGGNEWRDDSVAATMTDSPQQQQALDWLNEIPEEYGDIVVSGHSKGGNKAMYVAVVSNRVKDCYAFDGEGFSQEFCLKYGNKIKKKAGNIHLRSNYRDYVNALLITIAGDVKYVRNDVGVANAGEYHMPNALFRYKNGKIDYTLDENGNAVYSMGRFGAQDPTMEMFHNLTVYMLENATPAEKKLFFSVFGEVLTMFMGENVRTDILEMFSQEAGEIFLNYFTKYLQTLMVTDPLTYAKYRKAFKLMIGDALGASFWSHLSTCFHTNLLSFFGERLFDGTALGIPLMGYRIGKSSHGDVRGRDFSWEVMQAMLGAARETEEEQWWQVNRWDCWYRIEDQIGLLDWDRYAGRADTYYRKLIDINEASAKDIQRIFDDVYRIDGEFGGKMSSVGGDLAAALGRLQQVRSSISPK